MINRISALLLGASVLAVAPDAFAICAPDPAGVVPVTNNRSYYLSEIGGCANLVCWLDNVPNTAHSNATLVIDQLCDLNETLTVPQRMVLAGVGSDGEGILSFHGLGGSQAAIRVAPGPNSAGVTIRDLRIVGDNPLKGRGIELVNAHQVVIDRVRISGFGSGVYGYSSFSVVINESSLHGNNVHILQDFTANTWRVTKNVLNGAVRWGIYQTADKFGAAHQNSSVYSGNRLESNGMGGIQVSAVGTVIQNNEFEGNGGAADLAIDVRAPAVDTRILSNFYSGDCPVDAGTDTQIAFDIHFFTPCP